MLPRTRKRIISYVGWGALLAGVAAAVWQWDNLSMWIYDKTGFDLRKKN